MNVLNKWSAGRGARADAQYGLTSVDERITLDLGLRPRLDPVGNPAHGEVVKTLSERTKIEELREDIVRAENAMAQQAPTFAFDVGLVVALAVEVLGAVMIMEVLVSPVERVPYGLGLAFFILAMTAATAKRAVVPSAAGGGSGGGVAAVKRSIGTLVLLLLYTVFVGAITVVRIQNATDEDSSQVEVLAQSLLMLATSLGPAWIAEWLIRKRGPSNVVRKQARVLRRRLRTAERQHVRAQATVAQITRAGLEWDAEAARRRAAYSVSHKLETARRTT